MKERSDLQLLKDARDFATRANVLTGGMSLEMMKGVHHYDHATRSYLTVLAAALQFLSPDVKQRCPNIPFQAIRGLRNRLVHACWRVDHEIVQQIVRDDLPVLIDDLDRIISTMDVG